MRSDRLFWGFSLIFGAIFLIFSELGLVPDINVFSMLLTIFLIIVILKSTVKMEFSGILFPIAILCIMYDRELGIESITPWTVLMAALLGSIGLSMIFPQKNHYKRDGSWNYGKYEKVDMADNGYVKIENSFGTLIKYVDTDMFVRADLKSSLGSMKVYFDKVQMQAESAIINVDASFAGIQIYIPKTWRVENQTRSSFGGVDEKNMSDPITTNTVIITGNMSFSGVEIIHI